MRMQFDPDDEAAFLTRRDELGEQFADWLTTHEVPGDPNEAGMLMDWKWGYADGALDRWQVADVDEFLFDWCPRKLSAPPQDCAEIPLTIAAFVEFLAHTTLLAGGDPPARIRTHCERSRDRFVQEMGNPENFGTAKSLFSGAGGIVPGGLGSAEELDQVLARMTEQFPGTVDGLRELVDDVDGAVGTARIGPVRLPDDDAVLASARTAPLLGTIRSFAEHCAAPGLALTAKGNLRLADARRLVEALPTGDDPELGGGRKLQSADQLPELSWYVHLAVESGAVRRHRGRLVAVGRFTDLNDVTAYEKVARAALDSGLGTHQVPFLAMLGATRDVVDGCAVLHLIELLDGDAEADELVEMARAVVLPAFGRLSEVVDDLLAAVVHEQLERLESLGVVQITEGEPVHCGECDEVHETGGRASLTPVGVHLAVQLAREGGIEVTERADPAQAAPGEILDLIGLVEPDDWMADARSWFTAQPDPGTAAAALASAALDEERESIVAMAGLQALDDIAGDGAVDAVRPHLDGPHDGIVVNWMLERGALDPDTVAPDRLLRGLVDVLAAVLDEAGPDEMTAMIDTSASPGPKELMGDLWRLDHPRLADVLDAVGSRHPVKAVAKAARKALVQHRSMRADRSAPSR